MSKATAAKAKPAPAIPLAETKEAGGYSKYYEWLINSWIFIPVLVYFKMVNQYALNLPIGDDYNAVLQFLNNFKTAAFSDKFGLLLQQHNEHRILSSRFIFLLYDTIAGNINFINLIFIANLQLVIIFIVAILFIKKAMPKYWNITALMVGFCIFDMNNYDNADFAMCGMQNYGVIMLFMLSLLFYSYDNRKYIIPAILCQIICIYSSGNGMIAAFVLVLFTVFIRDRKRIISSVVTFLIFTPLYFIHYTKAADQSTYSNDLSKIVPFYLHLAGGHFGYEIGVVAGVLMFIVLALVLPISKKIHIKENALPFLSILVFILVSNAVVSVFRSNVKMLDSYSSRYLIYPNMLAAIAFVLIMIKIDGYKFKWPVTIGVSLLFLYTYSQNYTYGEAGFERYQYRTQNQEYYFPAERVGEARDIANKSCQLGIYCIQNER